MVWKILIGFEFLLYLILWVETAVVPPPWADPTINPCAALPRGWQLLYWPPDGKCYKIFQMGYPCPSDMELSPTPNVAGKREFAAECRCPPKTAQSDEDGSCYELFTAGNCQRGYYFAPDTKARNDGNVSKRRFGVCREIPKCQNENEIYWPQNGICYEKLTRGPCPKAQLLTIDAKGVSTCRCGKDDDTSEFKYKDSGCYQHFTRGPCKEKGHIFLPEGTCGCYDDLPHYHDVTQQCFEIGSIGPCSKGEQYQLDSTKQKATCLCKKEYVRYTQNSRCYRPYTQGPCPSGQMLINSTTCEIQPCKKGELYFPEDKRCYRIGRRGPCRLGEVLTFDFETRPSLDGNSYNGVCQCARTNTCDENAIEKDKLECENHQARFENVCYKLYTQGPCVKGAWLAPKRRPRDGLWGDEDEENEENTGFCECMPGYTSTIRMVRNKIVVDCLSPTVILADYLNKNFLSLNDTDNDEDSAIN
ncbi:uncharacterized protein [Onthophagus taurus]|uniref:uncharacterized protein n=1 Tax=Onthophagus taurus TaxID=166361 RepID=UPI0039BEA97A